jgi:hypothetical protein
MGRWQKLPGGMDTPAHGYLSGLIDRLADEPVDQIAYDDPAKGDQLNPIMNNTSSSLKHFMSHLRKLDSTLPRGLFHLPVTISLRNSTQITVNGMFDD